LQLNIVNVPTDQVLDAQLVGIPKTDRSLPTLFYSGSACKMATNSSSRQDSRQEKLMKKHRQLSGYESSSPEDEEEDETFVTLQKLLKALNNANSARTTAPNATAPPQAGETASRRMGVTTSNGSFNDRPRLSQEEMLEERRQERERFRHMLFASKSVTRRRRRPAYYVQSEDDDEEEERVPSVESAISNRVISGSISRFNVHVIARDRWEREEVERLPIVLLPKSGKVISPADNPKLNVCLTNEFEELHDQLMDRLKDMPEVAADPSRLLTPPQSTWYMQMRNMDAIHC
jgi:hypothetical protein